MLGQNLSAHGHHRLPQSQLTCPKHLTSGAAASTSCSTSTPGQTYGRLNNVQRHYSTQRCGFHIRHDASRRLQHAARCTAAKSPYPPPEVVQQLNTEAPTDVEYDAVIIGGGMGGLAAAAKMVAKGARVVVLEKYLIPGGSAGHFKRDGYTFDVGSSMMFGFGDKGTANLLTRCLQSVGKRLQTVPDPSQVKYHLPKSDAHPQGLKVEVWRSYEEFIAELTACFPHEAQGIRKFYDKCWEIFDAINQLELKSLEEPCYLFKEFIKHPAACMTLAANTPLNTGEVARRYINDPELLRFIDLECYIWSTVNADLSPMINAGMVNCDRHHGGINYPVGGVGKIPEAVAEGVVEHGGHVVYKAHVKEILMEGEGKQARAVGVRLADGRVFRGKAVISNATRWDTFDQLLPGDKLPEAERSFRQRYVKAPSFFSLHLGVKADAIPAGTCCHHVMLDQWNKMEDARGTLFVSMPSLLDPSLAPPGHHVVHAFTPDWMDAWQGLEPAEYEAEKERVALELIERLEKLLPGLREGITLKEIGTPRTHRRFLNRVDGSYGPIPFKKPLGILSMPLNKTSVPGLYCVGDSTFPGQGVNAVVFSGFGCAHRVLTDIGYEPSWPALDAALSKLLSFFRERP